MRLYGRNSVVERLNLNPQTIKKIYVARDIDLKDIMAPIHKTKIPYVSLPMDSFIKQSRGRSAQGIIADVEEYQYCDFEDLLDYKDKQLTLLFLDGITDPQNFGGILRSAACLGEFAIILPKHRSVEINETVLHVASGAENRVPVSRVTNLAQALELARDKDYCVAGSVVSGGQNLMEAKLEFPLSLVIGSENKGVRQGLTKKFDIELSIPMHGANLSFNAAVATALFCYEITRQKNISKI